MTILSPAFSCTPDRKSTRLNSSHVEISYAVFCLKKKDERYEEILRRFGESLWTGACPRPCAAAPTPDAISRRRGPPTASPACPRLSFFLKERGPTGSYTFPPPAPFPF